MDGPHFSPTMLRRWIASELRKMRVAKGADIDDVASQIRKSKGQISHYETGRYLPSDADIEILLPWFGYPERTRDFIGLVRQARKREDWWDGTELREWAQLYLGLESGVDKLCGYEPIVVHGLFQTPAYAEALFRSGRIATEEEIQSGLQLRLDRQKVLYDSAPYPREINIVMDYSVLTRIAGDTETTRAQLRHLREIAELPKITIRVVPRTANEFAGAEGPFTVMDFAPEFYDSTGIVYVENRTEAHFYENAVTVDSYRDAFTRLGAAALDPQDTLKFIETAMKDLR